MNKQTVDKIIELNRKFYETIGDDFSSTRQNYWKGWEKLLETLEIEWKRKSEVSVCDLGCGNGRFYKFLKENFPNVKINYSGYDYSEKLLNIAKKDFPEKIFIQQDIIQNLEAIEFEYDLVVAFGFTHHIPSSNLRLEWHRKLSNLIKPKGLLCLTYWNGSESKGIPEDIDEKELQEGDTFLRWKSKKVYRYVHKYPKNELDGIKMALESSKMRKILEYFADGKDTQSNLYTLYKKHS